MSQTIDQPARAPSLPWMEPHPADIARANERVALDALPPTAIRHIDVPFADVFVLALKFFVAQVIIGAPFVLVIWYAFLR